MSDADPEDPEPVYLNQKTLEEEPPPIVSSDNRRGFDLLDGTADRIVAR